MIISIRDAALADAEQIVGVLNPIIASGAYSALDTPLTVEEQREFILGFPRRGIFLIAERSSDNRVVGFQSLEPFATYTHAFDHVGVIGTYVDLGCRRQGVGRKLFAAMFDRARALGYEKIFTYVRADNDAALAAYLAEGFATIGVAARHAKIHGKYIDEILIEKFL